MGLILGRADLIKKAEQYLDAHVRNVSKLRHSAATQGLLSSWGLGEHVQVAALVIPLIQEYVLDEETLMQMFGERVVRIANLAMEFGFQELQRPPENASAYFSRKLRNLYVCAYRDIESVLLCAADHLASTVHLDDLSEDAYRNWALETLTVDVPLLEMLGMWKERQGIADLALHLHDAGLQAQFEYYIGAYYLRHDETFLKIKRRLSIALRLNDLRADIQMHETTPASLYKRYERTLMRGAPFNPSDPGILRVDVYTKREQDCYIIMGLLHSMYSPSASTPIRDWIASPRYNGYRVLTTTLNVGNEAVEFRILTEDMADVNARGVLTRKKIKNAWWTQPELADLVMSPRGREGNICVFTPAGEIHRLKEGITVVDFAFRVHSQLGPYAYKFFVNGRPRPYNAVIQHCDLVEIRFDQSVVSLQPEWEKAVKTRTARIGIRRYLRDKAAAVQPGRAIIDRVLERESNIYNIQFPQDTVEHWLEDAARERCLQSKDELYADVFNGKTSPDVLVADMIENELRLYVQVPEAIHEMYAPTVRFARSWLQQPRKMKLQRASRITPKTEIVGRLVRKSLYEWEVVAHRADSIHAPPASEAIELRWAAGERARDAVQVTIVGAASPRVTWAVMNEIQRATQQSPASDIILYNFKSEIVDGMTHIEFLLDTAAPELIGTLEQSLNALRTNHIIKSFKVWEMFPGQRKLLAGLSDRRQRNPYTPHHIKDVNMFFGRGAELEWVLNAVRGGIHFIILHGDKRIGKTSLMYHLADHVLPNDDEANVIPVLFDMLRIAPVTEERFARGLIDAASRVIHSNLRNDQRRRLKRIRESVEEDPMERLLDWVALAEEYLHGRRVMFLVDEFTAVKDALDAGHLDVSFFQRMHHIVDRGKIAFLLVIHNHVLRNLRNNLEDMNQRGLLISLDAMDPVDAQALIRTPLERFYTYEPGVEEKILRLTSQHPFFIHIICGELFTRMSMQSERVITMQHLEEAVGAVLQSGFHRFAHYKDAAKRYGREALEVIAAQCGHDNSRWANLERIQQAMTRQPYNCPPEETTEILEALHNSGALQRSAPNGKTMYKIRVQLLHTWSLMGTSYLNQVTHDAAHDNHERKTDD